MALGLLALTTSVSAKTYIIHINSQQTFDELSEKLKTALGPQGLGRKDLFGMRPVNLPKVLGTQALALEAYKHLNMLAVEASEADAEKLAKEKFVSFIESEQIMALPPAPRSRALSQNESFVPGRRPVNGEKPWGIDAVKAPGAWAQGIKGEGVRVLVLDTGIDKDHPDIKNRFEEGKNFVLRRAQNSGPQNRFNSTLFGDPSEQIEPWVDVAYDYFDLNGHGTHCAGTILGEEDNNGVVGVAPQARLLSGRVCGKFGCTLSGIVNGLNWAIEKSVDVVSMSLGGPLNSRSQETALNSVDAANIVVVAASGNSAMEAGFDNRISYPANSPAAVAVGAINEKRERALFSQWGPELDVVGPGVDVESSVPQGSGRASRVKLPLEGLLTEVPSTSFIGAPAADAATSGDLINCGLGKAADFNGLNLTGKIALMMRGEIAFTEKVQNAIRAGAAGAMIYNNTEGLMSGSLSEDGTEVRIPVVMIEKIQGERLAEELHQGRGQSIEMQIYKTDYAVFSGTSMATPHVAGVVALLRAAKPNASNAEIKEVLKSTAQRLENPVDRNEFGSGLVNAEAGVQALLAQ